MQLGYDFILFANVRLEGRDALRHHYVILLLSGDERFAVGKVRAQVLNLVEFACGPLQTGGWRGYEVFSLAWTHATLVEDRGLVLRLYAG